MMRDKALILFAAMLSLGSATLGFAAETTAPSKAARETMAQAHEKMAACLRSDREIAACRTEMKQACKANMGKQACGMGMMGDGGHHGGGTDASKGGDKTP